jgi:hypothetical protein
MTEMSYHCPPDVLDRVSVGWDTWPSSQSGGSLFCMGQMPSLDDKNH